MGWSFAGAGGGGRAGVGGNAALCAEQPCAPGQSEEAIGKLRHAAPEELRVPAGGGGFCTLSWVPEGGLERCWGWCQSLAVVAETPQPARAWGDTSGDAAAGGGAELGGVSWGDSPSRATPFPALGFLPCGVAFAKGRTEPPRV